jgi:hypothetical protein
MSPRAKTSSELAARRLTVALWLFVALVVSGAVLGGMPARQVLGGVTDKGSRASTPKRPFGVGDEIPTAFGTIAIEDFQVLKGLSDQSLGGGAHGVGDLVGSDGAGVQAAVRLINTSNKEVAYTPGQFRLVTRRKGATKTHDPVQGTMRAGTTGAGSHRRGSGVFHGAPRRLSPRDRIPRSRGGQRLRHRTRPHRHVTSAGGRSTGVVPRESPDRRGTNSSAGHAGH